MNLNLPESVRVGPYQYRVAVERQPFMDDEHQTILCGQCAHNDGLIRVMDATPERMFVTFWHEVLHAISNMADTDLTEETVTRLAPILASVLMDNGYVKE